MGLKVKNIDTFYERGAAGEGENETPHFKTVTGTNRKGERVLVIWRRMLGAGASSEEERVKTLAENNRMLDEFFAKQRYNTLDMEFDAIYVNGDNNLMNLPVLPEGEGREPRYKVRLIEEEFKRLMFDVKDV